MDKKEINKFDKPVLVFDRESVLGQIIVDELFVENLCVFVSSENSSSSKNIIHIPLTKKIPSIPKCIYKTFILSYTTDKTVLDLLPFFISKAVEDNAHIYILLNIRDASEKLINFILDKSSRITVLLIGDLFGDSIKVKNPALNLLAQASTGRVILDNALSLVYPANITDVLSVIKRVINIKGVSGHRVLYLLPPSPVTSLSFVRALQKKEPAIKVDFLENTETKVSDFTPKSYQSVFGISYNFKKSLPEITIRKPEKTIKLKRKKLPVFKYRTNRLFTILIFSVLLTVFGLPIFSGFLGAGYLSRTKTHILANDLNKARSSVYASKMFFNLSQRSMKGLNLLSVLGLGSKLESISSGINTGKLISETAFHGIEGAINFKKVFLDESLDPKKELSSGIQNFKQAVLGVSAIKAESKIPDNYLKYVSEIENLSSNINGAFDVLPEVLGMEKKKKYLVLFQNNMELRPGGGFIGSYGILELDKGKIVEFPIYDVYDADGQLSQHIEPPFQLRKYMGVNHWYLRDSNFDLEFSKNGALASYFYNLETKNTVDGVIGIDVNFLKKMLSVTGPLKVAGYNETVTGDNFFKLTESYAQDNFFPGSDQKQNFLKAVATSLFARLQLPSQSDGGQAKLFDEKNTSYAAIAKIISDSISEKHLLFAFPDESTQKIFSINGASSSINDTRIEKEGVFNDFLGINEANLGENKVNYYLDRSISHKVDLAIDGEATEAVSVHYINKSKKSDKYGGDYKTYLRFILPKGAELQAVAFGNKIQETTPAITDPAIFISPGYVPQGGLEIEKTELDDKTVYGFLNIVPMGERKTVTINYTLKTKMSSENQTIDYSLRLFKQPGTDSDSFAFSFTQPSNYKILNASEDVKINNQGASLLTNLSEDREVEIKLGKR